MSDIRVGTAGLVLGLAVGGVYGLLAAVVRGAYPLLLFPIRVAIGWRVGIRRERWFLIEGIEDYLRITTDRRPRRIDCGR